MIYKRSGFVCSAVAALIVLSPMLTTAQEKDSSSYSDIGISIGILKGLMQKVYGTYDPIDVYACYAPGYGLLFVVNPPYKGLSFDIGNLTASIVDSTVTVSIDAAMAQIDSTMKQFDSTIARNVMPKREIERLHNVHKFETEKKKEPKNDYSEGQYNAVLKFLGSYADAENLLKPSEEIAVAILTDYESPGRIFSVTKRAVASYRIEATTGKQIQIEVDTTGLESQEEDNPISVLANILNNSFGKRSYLESYYPSTQNTKGFYVKGLGAVFVGQLEGGWNNRKMDYDRIEKKVIRVLSDYGPSLRFLPVDESITVVIDNESFGTGGKNLVVRLKKRDLDTYTKGEIDYETLQREARVVQSD